MKKISKKTLRGLAFVGAVVAMPGVANANWEQVYSLPTNYAHFITSEGIHLMSDYRDNKDGGIYYSEDNGVSWTKSDVRDYWYSNFYEAGGYVFASGNGCRIGRSEDGGRTWDILNYQKAIEGWVDEKVLGESVCYAIAEMDGVLYVGDFYGGGVICSKDYGETWEMTDRESLYIQIGDSPEKYMDNFYHLEPYKGKLYSFGLYSVHAYVPEQDKWETLPINSNCMASVTVINDVMVCGRAMPNYGTEVDYLLACDGEQWGALGRPETDDNNVRALGNDGKYLFSLHHGGPMYYSDNMGQSWNMTEGLPAGLYPLTLATDDEYVYTAVYSPIPSEKKSGLWRLSKSTLQPSGIAGVTADGGTVPNFDGVALQCGEIARSVTVMLPDGKQVAAAEGVEAVNLSQLAAGIYIYSVDYGTRRVNGKLMKR